MVGGSFQDLEGAVKLLEEEKAGHLMRKRQCGEAEEEFAALLEGWGETLGPANHKGKS